MTENTQDYPRPPRIEPSSSHVVVEFNNTIIADTHRAIRVLETGHPPSYYIPPEDVRVEYLIREPYSTACEWKGLAHYYQLRVDGRTADSVAWCYADPTPQFVILKHYLSFYPGRVDRCLVDGEEVQTEAGDFSGGWITRNITSVDRSR